MNRREDGTISLELVILAPVLIMLMMLMYAFGLYAQTESLVDQSARDAVRSATQSRSAHEADAKIRSTVDDTMSNAIAPCQGSPQVSWHTTSGSFTAEPPISRLPMNMVVVTVSCDVDLGDATFLPFLGVTHVVSTFLSPLDTFRGYYS
ncbi:MAG: TadE/TadG family type IV pilus assembly protein [Nocardioidaceae bacterium]